MDFSTPSPNSLLTGADHTPASAIHRFFARLFPEVGDGYLLLSWPSRTRRYKDGRPRLDSSWHNLATTALQRIADRAAAIAAERTLYYGVVVQHPSREPNPFERGRNNSAYVLPGFYFDLDLAYGAHAASALPATDAEALTFLQGFPAKPSLVLHTGGGLHAYWLFETPLMLTTDEERAAISHHLKQFAHTLCQAGTLHGWELDALRDLARVLRPPGTINFKYGKPVHLLAASEARYALDDFDWLTPLPLPSVHQGTETGIQGQPDLVTIIEAYGSPLTTKSEQEYHGAHPVHGSSTGTNLDVNVTKGLWHCWRHGTGGDALSMIALGEKLLRCEDLQAGALSGALFFKVLDVAAARFGWKPPQRAQSSPGQHALKAVLGWGSRDPFTTPNALNQSPQFTDPWLGRRSTWCGIPGIGQGEGHD